MSFLSNNLLEPTIDKEKFKDEKWKDNLDIVSLDKKIQSYLKIRKKENLKELEEELKDYKIQLERVKVRVKENTILNEIKDIEEKISKLKNNLSNYIEDTKAILEEYKKNKSIIIIEHFLDKAKKYYPYQIVREKTIVNKQLCIDDQTELEKLEDSDEMYCPICFKLFNIGESFEVEEENKREYDIVGHIEKIINQIEGNDAYKLPMKIRNELDEIIERRGLKKENIDKKMMLELLKETGNKDLKSHISKILFEYLGIIPLDLGKWRLDIKNDLELYINAFKEIEKTRQSNLNSHWLLFKLVQMRDEKLAEQIRYTLSEYIKRDYNEIWKKICFKNNWKFILD